MEGYSVLVHTNSKQIAVHFNDKNEAISYIAYIYRNYKMKFNSARVVPTHQLDFMVEQQDNFSFLAA
ncbi:hypothetical protein C7B76_19340 [filamentous cyanobacterium CCP2]|nr:hypothetical protein C7B76_19340 [filamentous cyanobacterium CCP2]